MADGCHFEKNPLNRHISATIRPILIKFGTVHGDASWPLAADQPLKFWIFKNPRWRQPPSWKITKIAISPQLLDRSLQNLVYWCKMGLLTSPTVKKFNFKNQRWRTAAILTRSSAIAEGPRDASCQLKSWQLPRNSAETTYTTSPNKIDGMKLEI